jgi:hypothetical protein
LASYHAHNRKTTPAGRTTAAFTLIIILFGIEAVQYWPRIEISSDKRYTTTRLRKALEKEIRERIADFDTQVVLINQEDSVASKELQAADFIAWALFQKHEHGDERYYEVLENNVIVEDLIKRRLW